jgi:hypothetical protein
MKIPGKVVGGPTNSLVVQAWKQIWDFPRKESGGAKECYEWRGEVEVVIPHDTPQEDQHGGDKELS